MQQIKYSSMSTLSESWERLAEEITENGGKIININKNNDTTTLYYKYEIGD